MPKILNGPIGTDLGDLSNVYIDGVTDGQTIIYQSSTMTWIPGSGGGGGGGSVDSVKGLTGAIGITSTGSSLTITTVGNNINFETAGIADGDKGDITVSGTGSTWTVDNNVITNAKAAQMATLTLKGNSTGSTANASDLSVATVKTMLSLTGTNSGDQTTSNSDGTITVSTGSTNPVVSLALGHANTWTGQQTFNTSAPIIGTTTANTALVTDGSKQVISSATTATEIGYVSGVTSAIQTQFSGKQALDSTLTALAAYNTNGLLTQTAADTFTGRTITGTSNRITLANGDGVSGNPTVDISATYVGQSSITTLGTIGTGIWQGTVVGPIYGGTGVNNGTSTITVGGSVTTGGALTLSGAFTTTVTITGNTTVTLPTTGTLYGTASGSITSAQLAASLTDETGTGSAVFATSPTLVTPALGTPTALVLTNATGLPVGSITGLGTGVGTFLATPSSANLASAITDETGTGALVFANTPTLVTPVLGVATATTINKVTLTQPASGSTLTVADGKTFTASNTITLTGTDGVSANVSNLKVRTIGFSASTPTTGQQGSYVVFPVAGTITGYKIVADAGTCTIKTWKIASGTAAPTISNLISTSGVALATGTAIISSTTSDFTTTTVSANDIFAFDLTAVSGATKLLFELEITVI